MVALTELCGIPSVISSGISFSVSVIVNYILSITMVFDADKDANKVKQFVVFLILSIIGLGINQLIMWGGTSWLDQYMERSYMLVKIVATAVVMVYNFITRKIFIEKNRRNNSYGKEGQHNRLSFLRIMYLGIYFCFASYILTVLPECFSAQCIQRNDYPCNPHMN